MKKKVKKYVCPLSGEKFYHIADRDLYTELKSKELASKPRKLTKIEKK